MSEPYLYQLIAIREMLNSPIPLVEQQGLDNLIDLLKENIGAQDLHDEVLQIAKEFPNSKQGITSRLQNLKEEFPEINSLLKQIEELSLSTDIHDINEPLPEKTKKGWSSKRLTVIIVCEILLILGLGFYIQYISPKNTPRTQKILPNLSLSYVSPKYVSEGDQNTIDLAIVNLDPSQSFSGSITLTFSDQNLPIMSAPGKNLSVAVTDLRPGDRITEQLKFTLPRESSVENIVYYFQVFRSDGSLYVRPNGVPYRSVNDEFHVSPIPYLKKILVTIFTGLGALLLAFLREQIMNMLKSLLEQIKRWPNLS